MNSPFHKKIYVISERMYERTHFCGKQKHMREKRYRFSLSTSASDTDECLASRPCHFHYLKTTPVPTEQVFVWTPEPKCMDNFRKRKSSLCPESKQSSSIFQPASSFLHGLYFPGSRFSVSVTIYRRKPSSCLTLCSANMLG